jgi:hypothetical protein
MHVPPGPFLISPTVHIFLVLQQQQQQQSRVIEQQ